LPAALLDPVAGANRTESRGITSAIEHAERAAVAQAAVAAAADHARDVARALPREYLSFRLGAEE